MTLRRALLSTTTLSGLIGGAMMTAGPAAAAELATKAPSYALPPAPAVDGINWKVDGLGGSLASRTLYGGRAAVTIPLYGQYGLQIDGAIGNFDRRFFDAIGGHLFWRDPSRGLLGVYASYTQWEQLGGLHASHIAGEGEAYWGRWTLQGIAGVESNNSATEVTRTFSTTPPATAPNTINTLTETVDGGTRFFDQVNLAYYLNDNWKAYIGHRYLGGSHAFAAGTEIGVPLGAGRMVALFAEGRAGEGDHHGVWGGLRVYFGQKDKPLIARHRQDDPWLDWLPASLISITEKFQSHSRSWTCLPLGEILVNGHC